MSPARLAMSIFNARRRLELAIAISLALHALLLTLHFKFPDAASAMREKAMDIVLVNSKSAKKPISMAVVIPMRIAGPGPRCPPPCNRPRVPIWSRCSVVFGILRRVSKPC